MKKLRITVGNKSYDVTVEDLSSADAFPGPSPPPQASAPEPAAAPQEAQTAQAAQARPQLPVEAGAVTSPMAGVIKSLLVKQGDTVKQGQPLVILEAMKMENQISAPVPGGVKSVDVAEGDSVTEGQILLVLE